MDLKHDIQHGEKKKKRDARMKTAFQWDYALCMLIVMRQDCVNPPPPSGVYPPALAVSSIDWVSLVLLL